MNGTARDERAVKELYQDETVAKQYIDERLKHAWWRHLHEVQVGEINRVIADHAPADILEIAPGPARLAPDVRGVTKGLMVEASPQMIEVARSRLADAGLTNVWDIVEGNVFDLSPLERQFDFVFTFRLIRHFDAGERTRIYEQVASRLKPGGFFLFDMVNGVTRTRLDRKEGKGDGLDVFDATYTGAEDIRMEMEASGFELVSLKNALNHFDLQSFLSYKLDDRFFSPVLSLVRMLDGIPATHPLEWVALFRKA
ncbi:class I SAM-dependent methyltransferase [bacterium]|nr:class I SAM-dependent methyltransferase [bacterium]